MIDMKTKQHKAGREYLLQVGSRQTQCNLRELRDMAFYALRIGAKMSVKLITETT